MTDVIPIVIAQHAEEAAFLWLLRDSAVLAPHYLLWELARLDNRVEAHLDGLRIAGEAGWEMVERQLDANQGPGEVFVAAFIAFETKQQKRIDKVLGIAGPVPVLRRGVISALGWLPAAQAIGHLQPLLTATDVGLRHIGLGAAVAHRSNPGLALEKCLNDLDFSLRSRALRAVGEMGYSAWLGLLRRELRSSDLDCRFSAAWSLARLTTEAAAVSELQTIALAESRYRPRAVATVMRRMEPAAARRWIGVLEKVPGGERLCVYAAGALGDPAVVPFLLDKMTNPALARLAGESLAMISGVNIAYEDLEGVAPEGFESGPNENPLDERVELDPDEHLPWPNVEKLKIWWTGQRGKYQEGTRYLAGQPISIESLNGVLKSAYQRQRAAAALEIGLRQPTQPLFEIRAPGFRQ